MRAIRWCELTAAILVAGHLEEGEERNRGAQTRAGEEGEMDGSVDRGEGEQEEEGWRREGGRRRPPVVRTCALGPQSTNAARLSREVNRMIKK